MKKTNYDSQMRKVDAMHSRKVLRKIEDDLLTRGRDRGMWRFFEMQQQQTLGLANIGGGITIPATATWLSQAWDSTLVYPAGNGSVPVAGSFVQFNGVVYAIPGTTASTAGTPPPGGVWVVQNPGPGMNAWQVNPFPKLSTFANPALSFPQPPASAIDVPDSAWYIPDLQGDSTTNTQSYIPGPGVGLILSAGVASGPTLQYNLNGTWTNALALTASTYAPIFLDGLTWRVLSGTARVQYTLLRARMITQY